MCTHKTPGGKELADIIRCEFKEMPGLRVTALQAKRLWNLDDDQCAATLRALVEEGFLRRTKAGMYVRA